MDDSCGLRGGGERHLWRESLQKWQIQPCISRNLAALSKILFYGVMETGKSKSVETICLLKQINILMIFAKFAALKIYFWPIAKFKSSKMHAFHFRGNK